MDFLNKAFGEKLKAAIKARRLTQDDLAEKLQVKPATVSRWCTGHNMPEPHRLAQIMKILGVDEAYFLGATNEPPVGKKIGEMTASEFLESVWGVQSVSESTAVVRLVAIANRLPPAMLGSLIQVAESLLATVRTDGQSSESDQSSA